MMLAFVTSLRHPQNSNDYSRVEALLAETLESVTRQTNREFVVIVVGNKRPAFELPERAYFVPVDFPPPAPPDGPRTARGPFVWDKGTKIGIGLAKAREFRPDHVMIFDADDFVHSGIAEYVTARPGHSGWVIERGWKYSRARNAYRRQAKFNRTCGTSFILPFEAYGVPEGLAITASQQMVADAFGERLETILGAHHDAREWHAAHGRVLERYPMRAAVYQVDTGENHSGTAMKGLAHPLDRKFIDEFGVRPQLGAAIRIWRSIGPLAVLQTGMIALQRLSAGVKRVFGAK
ncbi:glycosyltransferase family A protein [Agromyces aureus]|nr:glycosyltransferase family A protein [Agromyces aureus]